MLCKCSNQFKFDESETGPSLAQGSRELSAKLREGEAKLLQGSIREAEVSLREALSFNNEVHSRVMLVRVVHMLVFGNGLASSCASIWKWVAYPLFCLPLAMDFPSRIGFQLVYVN